MKRSLLLCAFLALARIASAQSAATPPVVEATPVDTVITSSNYEMWSNETGTETYAIFKGNVVVTGTNLRITCDRVDLTAVGHKPDASAPVTSDTSKNTTAGDVEKFKRILATGKVRIIQGDREANCERAEVLPRESKIVLTGQPVVVDHGVHVTWIGEPMTLYKNERRVTGDNVKFILPPIKDLGFDKNAPGPKPDAPAP